MLWLIVECNQLLTPQLCIAVHWASSCEGIEECRSVESVRCWEKVWCRCRFLRTMEKIWYRSTWQVVRCHRYIKNYGRQTTSMEKCFHRSIYFHRRTKLLLEIYVLATKLITQVPHLWTSIMLLGRLHTCRFTISINIKPSGSRDSNTFLSR